MTDTLKATIRLVDGQQAVLLPDDIHLDGDEVFVRRDQDSGDVILSAEPRNWQKMFDEMDAWEVSDEDWELFDRTIREAREGAPPSDDNKVARILVKDE